MKIGIDGRPLSYGFTGNSRYLGEALKELIPIRKNDEFHIYSNKPITKEFFFLKEYPNCFLQEPVGIPGPIWLQLYIPILSKLEKWDLFWGTLQLLPFRKLSCKEIVNYHDLNFLSAPQTMTTWNRIQHKFFSKRTMQNADAILCLSQNTFNEIQNYNPESAPKLVTVYPGAKKANQTKRPNLSQQIQPQNFFFTIGTVEPRKNFQTLVSAFQKYREENGTYFLVIAGRKGWGQEELYEYLHSGNSQKDSIFFIELPSEEELGWLYQNCICFLFPSIHEGFGLPIIEAFQYGKQVFASKIPVFEEILEHPWDKSISTQSVEDWKEALQTYKPSTTPTKRKRNWTWEETGKAIDATIHKLERK